MDKNNEEIRRVLERLAAIPDSDLASLEKTANAMIGSSAHGGGVLLRIVQLIRDGRRALAAPPRNCDVGTAEEQGIRCLATMRYWRKAYQGDRLITAIMKWAQMPYEEGGAADNYWRPADETEVQSGAAKWCMACSTDCPNKHTDSLVMCERFSGEAGK